MKNIITLILGALLGAVGTSIITATTAPAPTAIPLSNMQVGDCSSSNPPSFPPYVPLDYEYLQEYGVWCDREGNVCIEFQLKHVIGGIPAYTWWRMDDDFVQNVVGEFIALGGEIK